MMEDRTKRVGSKVKRSPQIIWRVLRERNLDWLFYKRVYMDSIESSRQNRFLVYCKLLFQAGRSIFLSENKKRYRGGLFYIDNSRHYDQARRILPYVTNVLYHNNTTEKLDPRTEIDISAGIYKSYGRLFKYLPSLFFKEFRSKSKIFRNDLSGAIYGILLYEHFVHFFRKNTIDYVVIFTDHSFKNRALLFAAKQCGVKTIYIPHASVSENFPPLEFDTAFLEGRDMINKYNEIARRWNVNSTSEILISGNIKINYSRNLGRKYEGRKVIGLAYNKLDVTSHVENVVKEILADEKFKEYYLILRPHPGIEEKLLFEDNRVSISDAVEEDVVDFLNRISCLISGDSNIVLDAALLKVPVFIIDFSREGFNDVYNFIGNDVCPKINSVADLHSYVNQDFSNFQFNEETLSYYDWSFGKNFDSVQYVKDYLNDLNS